MGFFDFWTTSEPKVLEAENKMLTGQVAETTSTELNTYFALSLSNRNLSQQNKFMKSQLQKTGNFYLSNNRETFYQSQLIDDLNGWYRFYLYIYIVFMLFYILITYFVIPSSFSPGWLVAFMLLPVIANYGGDMVFNNAVQSKNQQYVNYNFNIKPQGTMNEQYVT